MIGKTILNYKTLDKLPSTVLRTSGEGGVGVVYKTEDTNLKRKAERLYFASNHHMVPTTRLGKSD